MAASTPPRSRRSTVKGPRTPSQNDDFEPERERPTRRERSARHKKRGKGEFDRPKRSESKPRPWDESDWAEDEYLDDLDDDDLGYDDEDGGWDDDEDDDDEY
jgi:hypothetical protein